MTLIWALFAIMALGGILFLAPVFFSDVGLENDTEVRSYFAEIDAIKARDDIDLGEAEGAVARLESQILEKQQGKSERSSTTSSVILLLAIAIIGGGVYFLKGSPDLTDIDVGAGILQPAQALAQAEPPEHDRGMQLADLVEQLEVKLKDVRESDPNGWLLYARSLMNLGRFEEAIAAYDKVVVLTEDNPDALDERARAKAFIAQRSGVAPPSPPDIDTRPQRGPTDADVRDAQTMSEADREAMIQGMVEGLAARLDDNPNDPSGWSRLIRARTVLGQFDQAAIDVARMKNVFESDPKVAQKILESVNLTE